MDKNEQMILVTGGAGFIGSHLVRLLRANELKVRILDPLSPQVHGPVPSGLEWIERLGVQLFRGSVNDRATLNEALDGVTSVVHLAAETGTGQSMYEVEKYCHVNVTGTALLLDILANDANRKVKRIVLASSRSVYGEGAYSCPHCNFRGTPEPRTAAQLQKHEWEPYCPHCRTPLKPVPTRETDAIRPASIYAATKYSQEELVRVGCEALGIDYSILRFQNVYGEGQSLQNPYTGILSIFSTRIRRGLELPIFEDGKETRDFVHVSDIAQGLYKALHTSPGHRGIYNVGSGIGTSVLELATALSNAFGRKPNLRVTSQFRVGDIRHNIADLESLREGLSFVPGVSLETGLKRFAQWVLQQPLPEDRLDQANQQLIERKLMG